MILKEDKIHYSRNFKIALILSLSIAIMCFLFFPDIKEGVTEIPVYYGPIISLMDIPPTSSSGKPETLPPEPIPIIPENIVEIDELVELPDVEIKENTLNEIDHSSSIANSAAPVSKGAYEFSSLPFTPRQILEVVPKEINGAEGQVVVSLKIGEDGYVKEHKIIKDNTNKNECVKSVIASVYKSRWQPIIIEGERIEYWVEKVYKFN